MSHSDDRIHACLDGEIPREALDPEELRRLEALEGVLADAAAALTHAPVPDLTAAVMAGLPEESVARRPRRESAAVRLGRWLWTPVSLTFRPAYAFGAVPLALTLLFLASPGPEAEVLAPAGTAAVMDESPRLYVQFRIEVPGASQVAVAGSFTAWRPDHQLTEVSPGVWSALVPLAPGVYDYTYVIDGERMVVDPYAPQVADSFGGSNSRLFLPAPNESA